MFLNWADCTEGGECLRRSPGWTGGQATVAQTGMAGRREGVGVEMGGGGGDGWMNISTTRQHYCFEAS